MVRMGYLRYSGGPALFCPFCGAKPKHDCVAIKGGRAAVHVLRIKAAALTDVKIPRLA